MKSFPGSASPQSRSYLECHDSLSLRAMVKNLKSRYVPVNEVKILDPDLLSFININKSEDLERINTFD
jgi:molybdopterin-guanine dinucleotide biosynthesis protein A